MENTNYLVRASDCFIYVLADNCDRAMEIARSVDPVTEILDARRMLENDETIRYVVFSDNILAFLWGDTGKACVLRSADPSVPEASRPILTTGRKFRPAVVSDFRNFRVVPYSVSIIYSPNEAALNDGAGFWNDALGYADLENAQVFSSDEHYTRHLPVSTGQDARYARPYEFAPDLIPNFETD